MENKTAVSCRSVVCILKQDLSVWCDVCVCVCKMCGACSDRGSDWGEEEDYFCTLWMISAETRPPIQDYYGGWILSLCLWSWGETSVFQIVHQLITKSEQKVLLIAFLNSLGVVCHRFVHIGQNEAFDWCRLMEETEKWRNRDDAYCHVLFSTAVLDEEENLNHAAATIFSRSHTMWFLSVPETQDRLKGRPFVSVEEIQWCVGQVSHLHQMRTSRSASAVAGMLEEL